MLSRRLISLIGNILFLFKRKSLPRKIKKILFFKIGALGDVVMTTPIVRQIRKKFPDAKIDYLVGNYAKSVLTDNKYVDEIITFDQNIVFKRNLKGILKLANKIKQRKYDLCFVMDKAWEFSILSSMFKTFSIGFNRFGEGFATNLTVNYDNIKHEVDYYLSLGKYFNINLKDKGYDIFLNSSDKKFALDVFKKNKLKNVIGIAPGGALNPAVGPDFVRRLDPCKFKDLIKKLNKKYQIILLGGNSDKNFNDSIIKEVGGINLTTDTIQKSVALMAKCKYVICNDSGPMHFAAASGTKVISLFGPTNPKRKAPLTKGSLAIWKDKDIYDGNYELYGTIPKNTDFFKRIEVKDIFNIIR